MADGDEDAAPLPLRWIEELVNTRSIEFATDDVSTPDALAGWLRSRDLLPAGARVTPAGHQRALRFREGLRSLIAGNNTGGDTEEADDAATLTDLAGLAASLPLVLDVSVRPPRLAPAKPGTLDAALARLLAVVAEAVADGSWFRMKACREPQCRWAYYDHSRNRSRAWCSMASCGNRAKARAFREREHHGR